MKRTDRCVILGLCCMVLFAGCSKKDSSPLNRSNYFVTVLTGPTSGIYYPIGGAFSSFIRSLGYKTSATAAGATVENINALISGQGEMAIAMADAVIQGVEGFGAFEGKPKSTDLRAI